MSNASGAGRGRPNLRRARERRGWGQERLGREIYQLGIALGIGEGELGVDQRRVSHWEAGKAQPGTIYTALICMLLELPPDKLDLPALPTFVELTPITTTSPAASTDRRASGAHMSSGAPLEDDLRRRTFTRYLALTGGLTLLRPDVLATAFGNGSGIDDALADRLNERSLQYMTQWDQLPPDVLYTVVMGHVEEIRLAINCVRLPRLRQRLIVAASEATAFAGMLGWFTQDRGLAEMALSMADSYADASGHSPVAAVVLTIRADFHSSVQLGRQQGSPISRAMLEAAEAAAGKAPSPERAWILLRQAEEYAVIGDDSACHYRLEMADAALAALKSTPRGMFGHWNEQMHHAFRGNCAQLLGKYRESLDILSPILRRIGGSTISNRVSLQTDMAAVLARQGEPQQASVLLTDSLSIAINAGLRERVKRIVGVRSGPLEPFQTHAAVRLLDEQLATLPASTPTAHP